MSKSSVIEKAKYMDSRESRDTDKKKKMYRMTLSDLEKLIPPSTPASTEYTEIKILPITISSPGRYRLKVDLNSINGTIDITESNVDLDLNGLLLTGEVCIRIKGVNLHRINISNGIIAGSNDASRGIHIVGGQDITISKIRFDKLAYGIHLESNCQNIRVSKCVFTSPSEFKSVSILSHDPAGENITQLCIEKSFFYGDDISVSPKIYLHTNSHVQILKCSFIDVGTAIVFTGSNNLLVKDSQFLGSPFNVFNLIQIGTPNTDTTTGVIIRGCQFDITKGGLKADAIDIFGSKNTTNVVIESSSFKLGGGSETAIRIGEAFNRPGDNSDKRSFSASNVLIQSCQIDSNQADPCLHGIIVGCGNNIRIIHNQIQYAQKAAILVRSLAHSQIMNNSLSNGKQVGVLIDSDVHGNILVNNNIFSNCEAGIYLKAGSRDNLIKENTVYSNGNGILDIGANRVDNNTVFSNINTCDPRKIIETTPVPTIDRLRQFTDI